MADLHRRSFIGGLLATPLATPLILRAPSMGRLVPVTRVNTSWEEWPWSEKWNSLCRLMPYGTFGPEIPHPYGHSPDVALMEAICVMNEAAHSALVHDMNVVLKSITSAPPRKWFTLAA